ncbi:MAG: hypothetical protein IIA68_00530 [Proteobacteria bacterium]|nr:hypothetical protein [Pseudomonadota bacterium]
MSAESLSSAGRRHSLVAIIASTFGIGVNLGIVTPLVTLILERDGVNAAFIKAYEVGGATGPALGGAAMDLWDPHGLPLAVAGALRRILAPRGVAALERGPKFELRRQILPEFRHLWVAY